MKTMMIAVLMMVAVLSAKANDFDKKFAGKDIAGHFVKGQCLPYARALYNALSKQEVECARVTYRWNKGTKTGLHAVVIYKLKGKVFVMDNESTFPTRVKGDTDLALIKSFDRLAVGMVHPIFETAQEPMTLADVILYNGWNMIAKN